MRSLVSIDVVPLLLLLLGSVNLISGMFPVTDHELTFGYTNAATAIHGLEAKK